MRSRRNNSRSAKKLNLQFEHRKLKLSKSSHSIHQALQPLSNCIATSQSDTFTPISSSQQENFTLYIDNSELLQEFKEYPLRKNYSLVDFANNGPKKNLLVISKIGEFEQRYSILYTELLEKVKDIEWIIITKAINSQQIQLDFNQRYRPIKFYFFSYMSQAINHINFPDKSHMKMVNSLYFSHIRNFETFFNSFACIEERKVHQLKTLHPKNQQLWLINEKDKKNIPQENLQFFFLNQKLLKKDQISIPECKSSSLLFILERNHEKVLSENFLQNSESEMTKEKMKKLMLNNLSPRYCQKIAQKYFPEQIICTLLNFPEKISKQFSKQFPMVASYPDEKLVSNSTFFCIHYGEKDPSDLLGIEYNIDGILENQIFKAKSYFNSIQKLKNEYRDLENTSEIQIFMYNIDRKQLKRQIEVFSNLKLFIISSLSQISSKKVAQNVILIGKFKKEEKKEITELASIEVIDVEKCSLNQFVIHNQIMVACTNLLKKEEDIEALELHTKVVSFNVDLEEFKDDPVYVYQQISEFNKTISSLEENCQHLLLMKMSDFNEKREKVIDEIEKQGFISFEIYFQYGNQFILRSKTSKYNFLKRQQLLGKVQQMSRQNKISMQLNQKKFLKGRFQVDEFDQKMKSQMLLISSPFEGGYLSTPQLNGIPLKELFVLAPKTFFSNNILSRYGQGFTLLIYHNLDQIRYFTRHLGKSYYAAIIMNNSQPFKFLDNKIYNCEYIVSESEKEIRQNIQRIVLSLGMKKNNKEKTKQKGFQKIILFDSFDSKSERVVSQMQKIYKNSKVISFRKEQFKQLSSSHQVVDKVMIYQMGQTSFKMSKKIKSITDLLKIYMSPTNSLSDFTAQNMVFSQRQLFISHFYERQKTNKFKGKLHQIALSRSLSPKNKSFKGKEHISQTGLKIFQSTAVKTSSKRQSFSSLKELISLIFPAINKGEIIILVLDEKQFDDYSMLFNKGMKGVIWVIQTQNIKKLIFRDSQRIYFLPSTLESVLGQISSKFRQYRDVLFGSKDESSKEYYPSTILKTKCYENWSSCSQDKHSEISQTLKFVVDKDIKGISVEQIQETLLFRNAENMRHVLNTVQNSQNRKNRTSSDDPCENTDVVILIHTRNRFFIEKSMNILEETKCLIVTFQKLPDLVMYAQLSKTLLILEKEDNLKIPGALHLDPSDTPSSFSKKLKGFIESLRKWN